MSWYLAIGWSCEQCWGLGWWYETKFERVDFETDPNSIFKNEDQPTRWFLRVACLKVDGRLWVKFSYGKCCFIKIIEWEEKTRKFRFLERWGVIAKLEECRKDRET